jgi:hypothetical protein
MSMINFVKLFMASEYRSLTDRRVPLGNWTVLIVWKEVFTLSKTKCRPERVGKPGPKAVSVQPHKRSTPKPINRNCGK